METEEMEAFYALAERAEAEEVALLAKFMLAEAPQESYW